LQLKVDDALLSAAAIGTPLPLDPGTHTLEASAPNHAVWHTVVNVRPEPEHIPIDVPDTPLASAPSLPVAVPPSRPSSPPAGHGDSGRGVALWSAVAMTAAGVGVGSVFGVLTFQARDSAKVACPNNRCGPGGLDDISRARTYATISTVGFGVGLASVVVAGYFLFKGGHDQGSPRASALLHAMTLEPSVSLHQAALSMQVRFE
jgi:hypothetical protein